MRDQTVCCVLGVAFVTNVTEPAARGERRKPTKCRHGSACCRQTPPAASAANYRLFMADSSPDDEAVVAENAALIVGRLVAKLDTVTQSIQQLVVAKIAELGGDPQLTQLLRDTVS